MPASRTQVKSPLGRLEVLAFACTLSMITYLDRVCFGAAVPFIIRDLGLKDISDLKWAFTAFSIAYATFEVPSGWLGDAFGPRRTLLRIVIGWSIFTALTGLVGLKIGAFTFGGLGILCLVRFLFGIGEAGAFPNLARVVANWFPSEERGRAKGWIWMSGRFMGGITPLIWTVLVIGTDYSIPLVSWRGAFLLFGAIGLVWCVVFACRFKDHPAVANAHSVPLATKEVHAIPWKLLLTNRSTWLLGLMYACASFSWYFNITYFPSYLETRHGLAANSLLGAILKGGPLLLGGFGCLLGGYWTDFLTQRLRNRSWARRIPAMTGHGLCGCCYLVAIYTHSPWTAALAISLAAFSNDLMMGAAWAICQDIGQRHTAVVAGWMNMLGNLGGAISGWTIGTILVMAKAGRAATDQVDVDSMTDTAKQAALVQGYDITLMAFVVVSFVAVLAWLPIDAEKPLE
ncbi:MAG: MFS transporter [Planctomycetota bacterium]|nr:MFS transporter [Planctomycetota bacterium]